MTINILSAQNVEKRLTYLPKIKLPNNNLPIWLRDKKNGKKQVSKKVWNDVTDRLSNVGTEFNKKQLDGKRLRISKDGSASLEFNVSLCYATGDFYLKHVFPETPSIFLHVVILSSDLYVSNGWKYEVLCKPEKVDKLFKHKKR